jgi:flagellar hook protein FlgE
MGDNLWEESSASGAAVIGTPQTGSLGSLQSAAVEDSNVDLTQELVSMITAQRVYQANAQTIKTMDQTMQTLVNLK